MVTSPPTRRPITELATRTRLPGRRSKAAREGNRGRVGSPVSGRYGDYMSERLSRAIWFFLFFFFLFPCKIHSFVRPEESTHSFAPTLASAGSAARKICQGRRGSAARRACP